MGRTTSTGTYGTVAVGATAVLILAAETGRSGVIVQNVHATQVLYVGTDDDVLTTTGIKITAGKSLALSDFSGALYGIASGADTDVRYFEGTGAVTLA